MNKNLTDRMDIDVHEVINAAATKPFGFVPYYPGPGIGGIAFQLIRFINLESTRIRRSYAFH